MTQHPTEHDLRAALLTLAPADLDASDFRARLDAVLANAPAEDHDDTVATDAVVIPLTHPVGARRRARSRFTFVLTAAACVAAIVALAIAFLPAGAHREANRDSAANEVPASVRTGLFPGTIVVGTYRGTGPQDITVPIRPVPEYFHYNAYSSCSKGRITVFDNPSYGICDGPGAVTGGYSDGPEDLPHDGVVHVYTGQHTTWQTTIVIEPDPRANGGVQFPVDSFMRGSDTAWRASGHGSSTIRLSAPQSAAQPGARSLHLYLVCTGSGVSMPGVTSTDLALDSLMTRTCFAGHEYTWQDVRLTLPADVRVVASPGTRWTIVATYL